MPKKTFLSLLLNNQNGHFNFFRHRLMNEAGEGGEGGGGAGGESTPTLEQLQEQIKALTLSSQESKTLMDKLNQDLANVTKERDELNAKLSSRSDEDLEKNGDYKTLWENEKKARIAKETREQELLTQQAEATKRLQDEERIELVLKSLGGREKIVNVEDFLVHPKVSKLIEQVVINPETKKFDTTAIENVTKEILEKHSHWLVSKVPQKDDPHTSMNSEEDLSKLSFAERKARFYKQE